MLEATEALLLDWYPISSEAWSLVHPRGLLSGSRPGITFTEFTNTPTALYIRRDRGRENTHINIFRGDGTIAYTIERQDRFSTLWVVYKEPVRVQVAKVRVGLFDRSVYFLGKPGIQHRSVGQPRWHYGGLPGRRFYLNDGAPHEWNQKSQYLERIINPNGGHEERRIRLARVKLLRRLRFDWELLVSPDFDEEIALTTLFISLLTEWSTLFCPAPGIRHVLSE